MTSILCQPAPLCVSNKYCSFFCAFAASSSTTLPPHSLLLNDFYFDFFSHFLMQLFSPFVCGCCRWMLDFFCLDHHPLPAEYFVFLHGVFFFFSFAGVFSVVFFFACCSLDMCFFSLRFVFFHIHLFLPCSVSAIPLWVVSFFASISVMCVCGASQ